MKTIMKPEKKSDGCRPAGRSNPVGRPASGVETVSFACRVPLKLHQAFVALARVKRTRHPGTELLTAAEEYIKTHYRAVRKQPDSLLIDQQAVDEFIRACEDYFRESGVKPPSN